MDLELGRIRVHEHAETGKPLAAYKLHQALGGFGILFTQPCYAGCLYCRQRWNGPACCQGKVGHKLSAIGLPYRNARS